MINFLINIVDKRSYYNINFLTVSTKLIKDLRDYYTGQSPLFNHIFCENHLKDNQVTVYFTDKPRMLYDIQDLNKEINRLYNLRVML